ncbi:Krueppel-like factor 5 [Sparganum proliferum]
MKGDILCMSAVPSFNASVCLILQEQLETNLQFTSLKLSKERSLTESQRALLAEAVQLRRILAEYRLGIAFEKSEVQIHSLDDVFLIGRSDYELLQTIAWERLTLLDLLKFRIFQLAATMQEDAKIWRAKDEASTQTVEEFQAQPSLTGFAQHDFTNNVKAVSDQDLPTAATQTLKNEENFAISEERQLSLLKADNEYLRKQIEILTEKLLLLKKQNTELTESVRQLDKDSTTARARALAAEKMNEDLQERLRACQRSQAFDTTDILNQIRKISEGDREKEQRSDLQQRLASVCAERDKLFGQLESSNRRLDMLTEELRQLRLQQQQQPQSAASLFPLSASSDAIMKSRLVSMEVQLHAACAAKNDAQLQVEHLSTKLEAASKAYYELDSERKVQLAQLEARLQVAERRLAAYNQLEEELDRAIEASAELILDDMPLDTEADEKFTSRTLLKIANLGVLPVAANGQVPSTGPLLPTLATRRLEHCLQLSRKLAESERGRCELQAQKEESEKLLKKAQEECKRLSDLLATIDKPAGYLATALSERDRRLAEIQQQKMKLEYRLRRLYKFTKEIVQERNAMVADVERLISQRQVSRDT